MKFTIKRTRFFLFIILFILGGFFVWINPALAKPGEVVINEIAWMGTKTSPSNEWIELYNNTSQTIKLEGWKIQAKDGKPNISLKESIPPGGYYLIERTDDETVPQVSADLFTSFGTGLSNNGEHLELLNEEGILVDEVNCSNGWYAGDNSTKATMERIDPAREGSDLNNWANSQIVLGTPKAQNSLFFSPSEPQNLEPPPPEEAEEPPPQETKEAKPLAGTENLARSYSPYIIINEILPNPQNSDEDEFIELKNIGLEEVSLEGWKLKDNSKTYLISTSDFSSLLIPAGGFFVLEQKRTGLALNNTGGDRVDLYQPNDNLLDSVAYQENAPRGLSYVRSNNNDWQWTETPTPRQENILINPEKSKESRELPSSSPSDTFLDSEAESLKPGSLEQLAQTTPGEEPQYPVFSKDILISEFLPNPLGSDEGEWIEIYNSGQETVDLAGWQLDDEEDGSNPYTIPTGLLIKPGQYLVFKKEETKIALNNTKDSVRLLSLDRTLVNQINYEQSQEGFSYAKSKSGNWQWTKSPTPGKENIITPIKETIQLETSQEKENLKEASQESKEKKEKTLKIIETNLKEVRNLPKNSQVKVKGLVAVEPGLLSTQYFYLAGSGLQIYMSKKDFPELRLGDWVEVTGQLSETSSGETRLKVKKKEDIRMLAHQDPPQGEEVKINQIGENLEGSLITLEGEIVEITGKKIYLTEGKDEVLVYLKSPTKIEGSEFKEGDKIKVTGIVSQTNSGYEVLPRYQSDLEPVKILGVQTQSDSGALNLPANQRKRETIIKYLLASGIAIVIILAGLEIKSRALSRVLGDLKAQVIKEIKKLKNLR